LQFINFYKNSKKSFVNCGNVFIFVETKQKTHAMTTRTNRWGECVTTWNSHVHPENTNFMQVVRYVHIEGNGKCNLYWSLNQASHNDHHVIRDISLSDALLKYTDAETAITEEEFAAWMRNR